MARTPNQNAQFFSLSGISLRQSGGAEVGLAEVTGMLELTGTSAEAITTTGGFNDYPVSARTGRRSGEGKLTVNECPAWLERAALGGNIAAIAAQSTGEIGTVERVSGGGSLDSLLPGVSTAAGELAAGIVWVTATGSSEVSIVAHTDKGKYELTGQDSSSPIPIAGIGVQLGAITSLTSGDTVMFRVYPVHSGGELVTVDGTSRNSSYGLTAWSVTGRGGNDALIEIDIPRCVLLGLTPKLEDNAAVNGVEIGFQMYSPDGGQVFTIKHISV